MNLSCWATFSPSRLLGLGRPFWPQARLSLSAIASSSRASSSAITLEDLDKEYRNSDGHLHGFSKGSNIEQGPIRKRALSDTKPQDRLESRRGKKLSSPKQKTEQNDPTARGIRHRLAIKSKLAKLSFTQRTPDDADIGTVQATTTQEGEHLAWVPRKRLSREAMEGIRLLHERDPSTYTTPVLATHLKVSPESIRRILRSKWRPNPEEEEDMKERAERRRLERIRWYRDQRAQELERMSGR